AIFLAYESKGLLIGESVDPGTLASICALAHADPAVLEVRNARSMHFGPQDVLLALDIRFRDELKSAEIAAAINKLEEKIRAQHPAVRRILIEAKAKKTATPVPAEPSQSKFTAGS